MKLCQKCIDCMDKAETEATDELFDRIHEDAMSYVQAKYNLESPVLESDCEFWSHKQLEKVISEFGTEVGYYWEAWKYPNDYSPKEIEIQRKLQNEWRERMMNWKDEDQ